ncbi:MAG: hypothetical protein ABI210_03415 [Abditibacteriaceae bacterium]
MQFPVLAQPHNPPATKEKSGSAPADTPPRYNPIPPLEDNFSGDLTKSKYYDIRKIAQTKVSIDVQNGTIWQIEDAIIKSANQPMELSMSPGSSERSTSIISLKLQDIPLGDALRVVAALAGTGFYILPNKFFIGAYFLLTPQERKQVLPQYYEVSEIPTKEALIKEGVITDGKK